MSILKRLSKFFCKHQYKIYKFQSLGPGTDYKCAKCGKMKYN